jgi:glycosyltransferase involved in cell wall biosynthesis
MKIAFLTLSSGYVHRGVETFVKEVGNRLSKKHEVTVFQTGPPTGKEKYKVEQIKLKIDWDNADATGTLRRKFFLDYWSRLTFWFIKKALPILREEKFDVIIPTDGGWETFICRLFLRSKMIVSGQSGPGYDDRWNLFWRPDVFVALSSRAERWAKKVGWGVRVVKIPNGVNLEKFNPRIRPKKVNLKPPIILCASALIPSKRIDLTIRAVAKLKNVSLLVIGDGDEGDNLKKLGKELLSDRFLLTKAKYEEMPSFYRAADLFTMVSVPWEAFGIVYVEALASGLPVVATEDENRREIIGEAGIFVHPENLNEYAYALEKALKIEFGDKPRRQAQKFSWDEIASQYEEIMIK